MKSIIHVNQHRIKANLRRLRDPQYAESHGSELEPVLTCKTYKDNRYGHEAIISVGGREVGRFVYRPDAPLSCGAHVWFETQEQVDVEQI